MKGKDLYTKIVLTIIAVSLVILVTQNFFQADSVRAQAKLSSGEVIDVNIAQIDGHPIVLREGSYSTNPVNITDIDHWRVDIKD